MIFRLADASMYTDMDKATHNPVIDRAIALHKMIRLFTLSGAGEGYLNFMGNEFGHPEWIDFPREGNGWSFHYCRRQWSLLENGYLKYQWLGSFDREMVDIAKKYKIFDQRMADQRLLKEPEKIIVYERNGLMFAFNFNASQSFTNILVPVNGGFDYEVILSTDDEAFGGQQLVEHKLYPTKEFDKQSFVELYLPARTALVLRAVKKTEPVVAEKKKITVKKATTNKKAITKKQ